MYQETTNDIDLNCNFCNKRIPSGSKYFDDSTYNSLYGKVEIQKCLCVKCGKKYIAEMEDRYQEYERSQRGERIVWLIILIIINLVFFYEYFY